MWKLPIAPMGFSHVLFCAWHAGRRCLHRERQGDLLIVHHHWQHSYPLCACSCSKLPIAPMGRWLTCPNRLSSFVFGLIFGSIRDMYVQPRLQTSHRPHGRLMFCSFLQGGGVYVFSGTVTMTSCSITGNIASVRAHVQNFPSPRWEKC